MSSRGFSLPIRIDNAVSPRFAAIVCGLHALGVIAVLQLPLPLAMRLTVLLVIALCGYDIIRTLGLQGGRRSIVHIELDSAGTWRLTDGDGDTFSARLLRDSRVTLPLVALSWRDDRGARHRAFLAADAVDRRALRRLRVRLRFAADKLS
ncbi:MAG: protein YgfX [Gammaproteobacteria bacterium]